MATLHTTYYRQSPVKKHWIHRYWWVIAFTALCGVFYLHGIRHKKVIYQETAQRLQELETEKALAIAEQEDLLLQIQSQSDPAWIEMVLKRNLGLVAPDQTKVYFSQNQ